MVKTKVFNWKDEINGLELKEVIDVLNNNGVIIYPTDTVYGIGCKYNSIDAINKLYEFKQRDYNKPINVLTNNIENIEKLSKNISLKEKELISSYMPGDLTIILDKNNNVPDLLTSNLKTVGVRIPNNKIALTILSNINYPLATTSANISGNDAGITINDFIKEFDGLVDIIIDGGPTKEKVASTIVRVENNEINILRQGNLIIKE